MGALRVESESNLKQFGFSGKLEAERLNLVQKESSQIAVQELRTNLNALKDEVLKDDPVSQPYEMFFGNIYPNYFKVYSDKRRAKEFDLEAQFDPSERAGATKTAFMQTTRLAKMNPGKMVMSISLGGKAGFDNNPYSEFNKINYDTIQLYHMFYDIARDKIFASAITASNEDLTIRMLQDFGVQPPPEGYIDRSILDLERTNNLNTRFTTADRLQASKVLYYLRQPVMTGLEIHDYIDHLHQRFGNETLHQSKSGQEHTVDFIVNRLNNKLSEAYEGVPQKQEIVEKVIAELHTDINTIWTKELVNKAYFLTMKYYAVANGMTKLTLAGSCGGKEVTIDQLDALLGNSSAEALFTIPQSTFHPLTSAGRLFQYNVLQSLGVMNLRHENYECKCGQVIQGEVKGSDPSTWTKRCPECNREFACASST